MPVMSARVTPLRYWTPRRREVDPAEAREGEGSLIRRDVDGVAPRQVVCAVRTDHLEVAVGAQRDSGAGQLVRALVIDHGEHEVGHVGPEHLDAGGRMLGPQVRHRNGPEVEHLEKLGHVDVLGSEPPRAARCQSSP